MKKGNQKYKKFEVQFCFGGKEFAMDVSSASEQWQLDKRLQEVGLHANRLPFLPWEDLFSQVGTLPDVPEHVQLPDEHLAKMRSAREFALEHVDTSMTISELIRAVKSKEKTLLKICPGFKMNLHMLRQYTQSWVEHSVHQKALASMPIGTSPNITMTQAIIFRRFFIV